MKMSQTLELNESIRFFMDKLWRLEIHAALVRPPSKLLHRYV